MTKRTLRVAIAQMERTYQITFKNSRDSKFIIDKEGIILDANTAFCERIGKKMSECIGYNIYDMLPPDISTTRKKHINNAFTTKNTIVFEDSRNRLFLKNTITPIIEENGDITSFYITSQDITELKYEESKINKHIAFSNEAMDAFPGPFTVLDSKGSIVTCNSYFRDIIAKTQADDISGINTIELFHPDDQAIAYKKLENIIINGAVESADLRVRVHGGPEYRWYRISTKRIIVDNDIFLVSSGTDIQKTKDAEKNLLLSNEQLRLILAQSKTGSWEWNLQTNTNSWSNEIWELYGLSLNCCEPSYDNWKNTIFEADRLKAEKEVTEASKKGVPFRTEWRVQHADGSLHWLMTRGIPFKDSNGNISRYIGIVMDVTELKNAEEKFNESEERFRKLFEDHASAILIIDAESNKIINTNKAATLFYGWSSDALCGLPISEISTNFTTKILNSKHTCGNNSSNNFPDVHRMANGAYREVELFCNRSKLSENIVYFCIVNDVTERNKAQQDLIQNKMFLDAALKSMSDAVFITDIDGSLIEFNKAFATFHRFSDKTECMNTLADYARNIELFMKDGTPTDFDDWPVQRALRGDKGIAVEYGLQRKDTSEKWIGSYNFAPIRNEKGMIIGSVITARDITHLKEAENSLRESEERFRNFFEQHSAIMMIIDPKSGDIIDVNNAATEFYGWSKDRLLQMSVIELNIDKPEDSIKRLNQWENTEKRTLTVTHRKADSTLSDIEVYGKIITVKDQCLAYLILHDITERKRFEQALIEAHERMHVIMSATHAGTWEVDVPAHTSIWSDELWQIHGVEPNSFPLTLEHLRNTVLPEDRQAYDQAISEAQSNGSEFSVSWRIKDAKNNIRWLMAKGNPIKNSDNQVVKYVGITLDITEQKRIEDEKAQLESRIQKSERLETIGTLAGGIAHDFNNILTPILSYAELGMMEIPKGTSLYEYFNEITKASERAQNLVNQILTFSKARESDSIIVSVQSVIEEALKLLRPSIPSTIEIKKNINSSCSDILADPSKIYQVIINLCTNAYQAMEETGGTLSLQLDNVTPDNNLMTKFPELHKQTYVRLTISDTGHGMDSKTLDHIFEPFFTTKGVNKGTGLGLSVVHGIITKYNGVIIVDSQPAQGSTFQIYLPASNKKSNSNENTQTVPSKYLRILLVDDEVSLIKVVGIMLSKLGHNVQSQHSALQALKIFRQSPQEFDLLITDLTMPEMTGTQLASEIHQHRPELPVILMTGFGKDIESAKGKETHNIVKILNKPVKLNILSSAINEVIDHTHAPS